MLDPHHAAAVALSRRPAPRLSLQGLDLPTLLAQATRLGTAPGVLGALLRDGHLPPTSPLLHPREATLFTNLLALDAAEHALQTLCDAGLRAMPLKGLARLLGPLADDPAARAMHDLDVLIDDDAFTRAHDALTQAGWRRDRPTPLTSGVGPEARFHLDQHGARTLLEIHRTLTFPGRHTPDTAALWRRAVPLPHPTLALYQLDPLDDLIYIGLHKAMHGYRNDLRDLVDADALLRTPGLDLDALPDRARAWRAAGPAWLLLERARLTFVTPLPKHLLHDLAPHPLRQRALQALLPDLAAQPRLAPIPNHQRPTSHRVAAALCANDCPALEIGALTLVTARNTLDHALPARLPEGHPLLRAADRFPLRPLEALVGIGGGAR